MFLRSRDIKNCRCLVCARYIAYKQWKHRGVEKKMKKQGWEKWKCIYIYIYRKKKRERRRDTRYSTDYSFRILRSIWIITCTTTCQIIQKPRDIHSVVHHALETYSLSASNAQSAWHTNISIINKFKNLLISIKNNIFISFINFFIFLPNFFPVFYNNSHFDEEVF